MKRFAMLTALICGLSVRANDKKPAEKDEDKLSGTWQMVSGSKGGEKPPDEYVKTFRVTFKGEGKLTLHFKGEDMESTFKIDAKKNPKWIDFDEGENSTPGIYEVDGDTLKICMGKRIEGRPTDFKPTKKNGWDLI